MYPQDCSIRRISDLSSKPINVNRFNNKTLLIVFGSTDCPANPLANPVLNKIYSKFSGQDLEILNIYTTESAATVQKYKSANDLKFPLYIAERELHSTYKVLGTPNFYVVGTDGKIKSAIDGYSDQLESKLVRVIEEELGK